MNPSPHPIKSSASLASSPSPSTTRAVRVGEVLVGGPLFVVMAGPCSIEGREQFQQTAFHVRSHGACLLRGGMWKLRTSVQSFQGLGSESLQFVSKVLSDSGMGFVSEITDPRQIEVLDDVVSLYQVGARNMFNYALLKELGNTRKPVLLKRSFAAQVDEWIKAADYLTQGGNDQVILCERGIRSFEPSTRYTFDLNAVLIAKSRTHFPVVVDPSHAIGLREHVPALTYAAAAAGADGVIVEVHPSPNTALSDGRQSLDFQQFEEMMLRLEKILMAIGRPLQRLEP
ncbi:MAG: 3-deoxy-7-phosphoheptulonate synthase [Bdellovibrio sp.]